MHVHEWYMFANITMLKNGLLNEYGEFIGQFIEMEYLVSLIWFWLMVHLTIILYIIHSQHSLTRQIFIMMY